ncbi:lymphotoxin-alpha [Danio aesculapii]|uniref:lymphotoxin-alpha n=1 Tax=Danio aesculapii TaxID=1142201 RepID=UPI0024BFED15|nr:lymphotoxin-alpha [Danio aesculapii]
MTGQSNPRFRLLIGWCCLMSSALLTMTVYLATSSIKQSETNTTTSGHLNSAGLQEKRVQNSELPALDVYDYIRLLKDKEKIWICTQPCESKTLKLNNSSVEIAKSGLYHIHAQVSFKRQEKTQETKKTSQKNTINLIKNKGLGAQKKLSEVISFEPGTLRLIRLVKLKEGDSISLDITQSMSILEDEYHTYWEIILLNEK